MQSKKYGNNMFTSLFSGTIVFRLNHSIKQEKIYHIMRKLLWDIFRFKTFQLSPSGAKRKSWWQINLVTD